MVIFSQQFNLVLQIIILLMLIFSFDLIKKRKINTHCNLISIALLLEIISIIIFMRFNNSSYESLGQFFYISLWAHHLLGLLVIVLIIYIILRTKNIIKFGSSYKLMKPAFILWFIVLMGGFILYLKLHM